MEGGRKKGRETAKGSTISYLLIKARIPFMWAPSSWPNYFPKTPPPNTITFGRLGFQHHEFWRETNIQIIRTTIQVDVSFWVGESPVPIGGLKNHWTFSPSTWLAFRLQRCLKGRQCFWAPPEEQTLWKRLSVVTELTLLLSVTKKTLSWNNCRANWLPGRSLGVNHVRNQPWWILWKES